MTDRPILFSAPMVRAILAGTKTQTRRAFPVQPPPGVRVAIVNNTTQRYGGPGDRLWVREAWRTAKAGEDRTAPRDLCRAQTRIMFDASLSDVLPPFLGKGRPSIHMPRWASRITLNVTGVRVERLQDISEDDARSEGVDYDPGEGGVYWVPGLGCASDRAADSFRLLWQQINGAESWDANPWVWVVEFERAEA